MERELATGDGDPARLSRPFDLHRTGQVLGEGAAALIVEELAAAQARGATILGEVVGVSSSAVSDQHGVGQYKVAIGNVLKNLLRSSGLSAEKIGHVHAHGLATCRCDAEEAQAIAAVFSSRGQPVPVVAAKSHFGNLGAASGLVELIASLRALQHSHLFPTLNYDTPDPECPVFIAAADTPSGDSFLNVSVTPQGQASGIAIKQLAT
jgi:3-oxoacyl-[acyl-carrier-protein] synthase II